MKKFKKGFTLVELVIVIAVIAVLTAVLVPTFIHLTKKARDASDKTVVKNANIQLAAQEQTQGKNKSMSDAVKDVDEIGYHIPGVATGNGNKIVWDKNTDRFVLLDKTDKVLHSDAGVSEGTTLSQSDKANYFYAVSSLEDRGDFAIYAKSDFEVHENVPTKSFSFTSPVSFDAGDREGEDLKIESISYNFEDPGNVLVATNSKDTVLTVNCPEAEFEHEGLVGKEIITAVKGSSFVEYGKVGFVQITSGHYVADQGADVKAIYLTDDTAKVDRENGGIILKAYGKNADVKNENHNVELEINGNVDDVVKDAMDALEEDVNPKEMVVEEISTWPELMAFIEKNTEASGKIMNDIQIGYQLDLRGTKTIDLNGHNILCAVDLYSDEDDPILGCMIKVNDGATFIINDSVGGGCIQYSHNYEDSTATGAIVNYGTVIQNAGTLMAARVLIMGFLNYTPEAIINCGTYILNGGVIDGGNDWPTFYNGYSGNGYEFTGHLTINGGSIVNPYNSGHIYISYNDSIVVDNIGLLD